MLYMVYTLLGWLWIIH